QSAQYDTTGGAARIPVNETASWVYDSLRTGYPTSSTSYSGGDTFTHAILGYNAQARQSAVQDTLTGTDGTVLAGGLVTTYGYNLTGTLANQQDSPSAGLPAENIQYGYDQLGQPDSLTSANWTYVNAVGYTTLGQPALYTLGGSPTVQVSESYDPQTQALTDVRTADSLSSAVVDDTTYGYGTPSVSKGANLLMSTTDQQNGGATTDTQCFGYDYATRLSQAWTATDRCAATPAPGNSTSVGGPNPYWQSWTYDAAGDRKTQTDHDTGGTTTKDTTTTYAYGTAAGQPHTVNATTATGPGADANTASYADDAAGDTTTINGGTLGHQTLTWTDRGQLATDTTGAGTTGYVYDVDGKLLVRRDPGQTTMYVGDEEITLNTKTGAVSATRYYAIGGVTIAARTDGANPVYLVPDRQGTDQLSIDAVTGAVSRRQYLPFGQARGQAPANWAGGDKGYVGGTVDVATGLENLGAREYDPVTGRFLSRDPKFESNDPNQMGGYDYAGNNPVTGSDPTGLNWFSNALGAVSSAANAVSTWAGDHSTEIFGAAALICTFIPGAQPIALLLTLGAVASGVKDTVQDFKKGDYESAAWDAMGAVANAADVGFLAKSARDVEEAVDAVHETVHIANPESTDGRFMAEILRQNAGDEMVHSVHHLNEARLIGADAVIDSANVDGSRQIFENQQKAQEAAEKAQIAAKERVYAKAYQKFIGPAVKGSPVDKQRHPDVPAPPKPTLGHYVA
ncbi:MAG TPA: RHS repeat-associated core domain-containing protein, partial [Pseudonocardiaceae bacterium]|nr:RHS repeat-associated core domain-containing protein [Pseudonocardiaceae bacterium]